MIYGIDECASGTDKLERVKHDFCKVLVLMLQELLALSYMTLCVLENTLSVLDVLDLF